jgi:hypothetical protein
MGHLYIFREDPQLEVNLCHHACQTLCSQFLKSCLPSCVHGTYILVRIHEAPEKIDVNSMLIVYSFWKTVCPTNLELFHIIIVPPIGQHKE